MGKGDPSSGGRVAKRRQRAISDLNEEQLQHKRDLDRKAQRALRLRTRSRIEDLEQELQNSKALSQELEAELLNQIETLKQQNRDLSWKIHQIGRLALSEYYQPPPADFRAEYTEPDSHAEDTAIYDAVQHEDIISEKDNSGLQIPNKSQSRISSGLEEDAGDVRGDVVENGNHNYNLVRPEPVSPFGQDVQQYAITNSPRGTPKDQQLVLAGSGGVPSVGLQSDHYLDGPRSTQGIVIPAASTAVSAVTPESFDSSRPTSWLAQNIGREDGVFAALPLHIPPTCPLDQILLDFVSSRRLLVSQGMSTDVLLGPEQPMVTAMIYPDRALSVHPVSRVTAEVLSTFKQIKLPERLALMFKMYNTIRWRICPNDENYSRLPSWLRPTAKQITTRHAAWIDNIPWPGVRDLLIAFPEKYPFPIFSELYSHTVSVNWSYDPMDAVTSTTTDESGYVLNPIFEKHIRLLRNWTVSREFETYYPEMSKAIFSRD